jgi:hypothetical protein
LAPPRQLPNNVLAGLSTAQDDILEVFKAAHQAVVAIGIQQIKQSECATAVSGWFGADPRLP